MKRRYTIELDEEQLRTIANCVEDVHRFICGQTELNITTSVLPIERWKPVKEHLRSAARLVNPELYNGQSYDWAGNGCDCERQRKFIASTYYIYRQILHAITLAHAKDSTERYLGVYGSPTLTCEDSGNPIRITCLEEGTEKVE
jgi:hypothetical protein